MNMREREMRENERERKIEKERERKRKIPEGYVWLVVSGKPFLPIIIVAHSPLVIPKLLDLRALLQKQVISQFACIVSIGTDRVGKG